MDWYRKVNPVTRVMDDGQSTSFTLNAGERMTSSKMSAELQFINLECSTETNTLFSDRIDVLGNGTTLSVHFPLLSNIKSSDTKSPEAGAEKDKDIRPIKLVLNFGHENESTIWKTENYAHFAELGKPQDDQPSSAWKIVRTYGNLTAGSATNQFSIVLASNSPAAFTNKWYLDVANPIVISFARVNLDCDVAALDFEWPLEGGRIVGSHA